MNWKVLPERIKLKLNLFFKSLSGNSAVFDYIYEKQVWGVGSGSGSLPEATSEWRTFLQGFLKEKKIKSVVDYGCGDWQFSKLIDWSGIDYLGVDVVKRVIDKDNELYGGKNVRFELVDSKSIYLGDLLIIKDVLQHLPNREIFKFFPLFRNFDYVLLVNDFSEKNRDVLVGGCRGLNLLGKPFYLKGKVVFFFYGKQVVLYEF